MGKNVSYLNKKENAILLNGKEYELVLTTKAARDITQKYGSLDKIGEVFSDTNKNKSQADLFDVIVFLTFTLVNQSILRHNFNNPSDMKPLVTADEIELFTDINDLVSFLPILTRVMMNDTKQNVKTEENEKNVNTAP